MTTYNSDLLLCPICKENLSLKDKTYSCSNRHAFDQAKEGYVNLLPPNKKSSKDPGDNMDMVKARRTFLETGHYDILISKIRGVIDDLGPEGITLLDSCCGEGYYTNKLFGDKSLEIAECYGFDISKSAIKLASKKYKDLCFAVASVQDIPIETDSIDLMMTIFSPLFALEFSRVLMKGGYLLVVSAGPDHLKELALMVYDEFKPHSHDPGSQLAGHFEKEKEHRIRYSKDLHGSEEILSLLKMTPYYWNTVPEKLEKIMALKTLEVTCEFRISLFVNVGVSGDGGEEE